MTEQNKEEQNWLKTEADSLNKNLPTTFEQLPSLKLVEGVITELDIDFSKPFESWTDDSDPNKVITKKIIPVSVNGSKMNWWLNVRNPIYKEIIRLGATGQKTFKILQTGKQDKTKYILVK